MFIVYAHNGNQLDCYVLDVLPGRWQGGTQWDNYYFNEFQRMWGLTPYELHINAYNLDDMSLDNAEYKPQSFTNVKPCGRGTV